MKKKIKLLIHIYIFLVLFDGVFAQQLRLKITSNNVKDKVVLAKINFTKIKLDKISLRRELDEISRKLQWVGYFSNQIDSIVKKGNTYVSYFSLGKKIRKAVITIPSDIRGFAPNNEIILKTEKIPAFIKSICKKLDDAGKTFSEVKLKNIRIDNTKLYAEVFIYPSEKRIIDKVIIKGYEDFSKSHINHFLDLEVGSTFNQLKLKNVSLAIQSLNFVSEIKPPEVLFSKDSTIIYIYLKKNKVNNFDGLLNFASNESSGGLLFNGHIDLQLNNVLNTGEQFELLWRANGQKRQDFKISTYVPYVFNSTFSTELSFNLYRQDSTFLNTKFYSGLRYNLNSKGSIAITYSSETSRKKMLNKINNSIMDFDNSFFGLQFEYRVLANSNFFDDKLYLSINPSFGSRSSDSQKENQFRLDFEASYLYQLNYRNSIFIRNTTGYLNSNSFLENEVYRIGGVNSIRGYNEQSIFTSFFNLTSLEYHLVLSEFFKTFSFLDFTKTKEDILGSLGFGISRINKKNILSVNITYNNNKKSMVLLSFKNFF